VYGEYFLRVKNKGEKGDPLKYLLNYYYYDSDEEQPYKMVNLLSSDITYTLSRDSITFHVKPLVTKISESSKVKALSIDYRFYLARERNSINRYTNCRDGYVETYAASNVTSKSIELALDVSLIST
jgi:hypothetical protein